MQPRRIRASSVLTTVFLLAFVLWGRHLLAQDLKPLGEIEGFQLGPEQQPHPANAGQGARQHLGRKRHSQKNRSEDNVENNEIGKHQRNQAAGDQQLSLINKPVVNTEQA